MESDSPSKTTLDPDSYQTPFGIQLFPSIEQQFNHTRMFYTKKKKYKKTYAYSHHINPAHSNQSQQLPNSPKAGLETLAEWLRLSTISLGVGKHVFDSALALLT